MLYFDYSVHSVISVISLSYKLLEARSSLHPSLPAGVQILLALYHWLVKTFDIYIYVNHFVFVYSLAESEYVGPLVILSMYNFKFYCLWNWQLDEIDMQTVWLTMLICASLQKIKVKIVIIVLSIWVCNVILGCIWIYSHQPCLLGFSHTVYICHYKPFHFSVLRSVNDLSHLFTCVRDA